MTEPHHREPRRHDGPASEAVQDYAKAIYALERRLVGPVPNSALADRLGVSPASITAMLRRMDDAGLVAHERYHGVKLTAAGERVALEVMRHHRLLESYLADVLGVPWDRVHAEAEVLEHYISEDLEERIAAALGDPSHDPHGDPIPTRELEVDADRARPLSELPAGAGGTFSRVSDSDPAMLRFLAERGIRPGAAVRIAEREPFGGPVAVEIDGTEHSIGVELAERMLIA